MCSRAWVRLAVASVPASHPVPRLSSPAMSDTGEFDRIARGGPASSTEARLKELVGWGGFTSFMSPAGLAAAADAGVEPVGQVVGLSVGAIRRGYLRTTRPGQGRVRLGVARRREQTGPQASWSAVRRRALARLEQQAAMLGANAVVGVVAHREVESPDDGGGDLPLGHLRFTGTAVRVRSWAATRAPVLTLASPQELWAMLRAGIEPAGIAGAFARVETLPSKSTVVTSLTRRGRTPNVELEDLTESVYEVRRLAIERLVADARALEADGLVGVDMKLEGADVARSRLPGLTLSVHVLASAVRRTRSAVVRPEPVLALSDGGNA
jgi:uncharacterized protein YbjQ (UPF0145 family)